ncbi:MAG: hypothetical protein U9Q04_01315 [Campylobacterota bacterium]|nr:hypothetical protein [Campylobacterota bacterium]
MHKQSIDKIKNTFLLTLIGSLFLGCSQSAVSVLEKDPIYAQNLQYTKIEKIEKNNEVEILINTTYLNASMKDHFPKGTQNFLVAIYNTNDAENNGDLTLNNQTYLKKAPVEPEDSIYKNIPLINKWAKYYIYTFPVTKEDKLILRYDSKKYGSKNILFKKY